MKKLFLLSVLILSLGIKQSHAQTVPKPEHVIIVIDENHAYSQIIGSSSAPYINSLVSDTDAALFTSSYALRHPSQPNYLCLYSGSDQGISSSDAISTSTPFTSCNLGASLIGASYTFIGYSEDLPSTGSLVTTSGSYARKHNPWSNWQGTGSNQIPSTDNQPWTSFPTAYANLPTVSFVIPNLDDDMHSASVSAGDTWLQTNLDPLIQWVKKNNSLLILTWDEDDDSHGNHIATLFIGQNVKGGSYAEHITHYNVLKTVETMYGLSGCDSDITATAITDIWRPKVSEVSNISSVTDVSIYPSPAKENLNVYIKSDLANKATLCITDMTGRELKKEDIAIKEGENNFNVNIENFTTGMYLLRLSGEGINYCNKVVVNK